MPSLLVPPPAVLASPPDVTLATDPLLDLPEYPERVFEPEAARRQHAHRFDRFAPHLFRADPLADDVVAAFSRLPAGRGYALLNMALERGIDAVPEAPDTLVALFKEVDRIPIWVDWDEMELGGSTFLRSGVFGFLALICYSLPVAYSSPDGNKPLTFSGKLVERAPRRLNETARFVLETSRS